MGNRALRSCVTPIGMFREKFKHQYFTPHSHLPGNGNEKLFATLLVMKASLSCDTVTHSQSRFAGQGRQCLGDYDGALPASYDRPDEIYRWRA